MDEKFCRFIILDNGSPPSSSMFFSPSTQATTLPVGPQNMEEPKGSIILYKTDNKRQETFSEDIMQQDRGFWVILYIFFQVIIADFLIF